MRSSTPKMLHPVCGRPMVAWPILAAREAGAGRVAAIVSPGRDLSAGLPEGAETVLIIFFAVAGILFGDRNPSGKLTVPPVWRQPALWAP